MKNKYKKNIFPLSKKKKNIFPRNFHKYVKRRRQKLLKITHPK